MPERPHPTEFPELAACRICPRDCGVNRYLTDGFCGASAELKINLVSLHHGEEPCLSGIRGSGTIFFSWCNLRCVFCQNYSLSVQGWGTEITCLELADAMLNLQNQGAHNINLVTPTHYSIHIIAAVNDAKDRGLTIPIVWNSSAYEKPETLKQLKGLVDIYLPDFKYGHGIYAAKYSHARDYPEVALAAIQEMFSQVGLLQFGADGIATQGIMIRILVLPNGLAGSKKVLQLLAENLGTEIHLSLMGQYYPAGEAALYPELTRGISQKEYQEVLDAALQLGFENIYVQELSCNDTWTPRFMDKPEKQNLEIQADFNPQNGAR